jgi:AraC-like DNA-binding protein
MFDSLETLKISLLHIGHVQLNAQWQFDKVISPFSRLYLITGGEGWVFHNNQKFILQPGYLYLIPSFTYSRYHCDAYLEQYYISFVDDMAGGLSIYELQNFVYQTPALDLDYPLFGRLLALNPGRTITASDPKRYDNRPDLLSFNLPKPNQTPGAYVESQGILRQLFSRFFKPDWGSDQKQKKSLHQLTSVLQHIHENLHQKLTVEKLAADHCLHPDYFSRLFLEILGIRPLDYINNKRLERAQLLLSTSTASLSDVAEMVGIPNIYYFSRLFKQKLNMPPGKYRKIAWQV